MINKIQAICNKYYQIRNPLHWDFDYTEQGNSGASEAIYHLLASDKPAMIARFGSNEISALNCILADEDRGAFQLWHYISGRYKIRFRKNDVYRHLQYIAGVFNIDAAGLNAFKEEFLSAAAQTDILASWVHEENCPLLKKYYKTDMIRIRLKHLEPYLSQAKPWTRVLAGKTVLVVHPFAESIQNQYQRREYLFDNQDILPAFTLKTLKAVQSIAGQNAGFATWLAALNDMKEKISQTDFDIALIGCGAYGMPLAAHCKQIGKKAVHLGGALQILFGIKGHRWEQRADFRQLFNAYWINPSESERPENASNIEDGCYW